MHNLRNAVFYPFHMIAAETIDFAAKIKVRLDIRIREDAEAVHHHHEAA